MMMCAHVCGGGGGYGREQANAAIPKRIKIINIETC
jgi:hypothetical protein